VTKNSKYNVVGNICVAVHDQRTGLPNHGHPAIGAHILGAMRRLDRGGMAIHPGLPVEGECLLFSNDVVTSPLVSILCVGPRGPESLWSSVPALPCNWRCNRGASVLRPARGTILDRRLNPVLSKYSNDRRKMFLIADFAARFCRDWIDSRRSLCSQNGVVIDSWYG